MSDDVELAAGAEPRYTDITKAVGTRGTMIIRDHGSVVEYLIACSDGATTTGGYTWSGVVNGANVGGTVSLPAGFGTKSLGSWTVTTSQTVTFHQNATGTQGLGGAADHAAAISRGPGAPPNPPQNGSFDQITRDSMRYLYNYGGGYVDYYQTRWSDRADMAGAIISGPTTDPLVLTGLIPGRQYWADSRAVNSAGASPWGAPAMARTLSSAYESDGVAWQPVEVFVDDGVTAKPAEIYISDGMTWKVPG